MSEPPIEFPADPPSVSVFDVVGEAGLRRLVAGFYCRIPGDDLIGQCIHRRSWPRPSGIWQTS